MTISSIDQQHLLSGQTWSTFCDHLKRCGEQILRPEAPADAATRAEGFRYLTRLLRIGLEMHIEFADPAFPSFFKTSHETAKIGADNPDNLYEYSRLDGTLDYRIKGHRGSVAYLSFGTQKGGYETDGTLTQTGFIDASQLQVDAQGNFEIILSQLLQVDYFQLWSSGASSFKLRISASGRLSASHFLPVGLNHTARSPACCAPAMSSPG